VLIFKHFILTFGQVIKVTYSKY